MCGDAETRSEHNFYVRKMRSAIDAPCGVVIVTGNEKVDCRSGSGGELVAVVGDVVRLGEVCNVVAGSGGEGVCKSVK